MHVLEKQIRPESEQENQQSQAQDKPNVYSDGSCTLPKQPELALSAAGIFWPNRTSDLSSLEHCSTEPKVAKDGIELR
eukprot:4707823-Karenia_brevis.AAC.1